LCNLFKGKLLLVMALSVAFVGGVMAVAVTTPGGQYLVHAARATATGHHNPCPGLAQAQKLAKLFSLSTTSNSSGVQAICSLHRGVSIQGTTRVFGYGEIKDLLIYAKFLAGGNLSEDNVASDLAKALQNCLTASGLTPLKVCLKTNIPGFQPGLQKGKGKSHATSSNTHSSHH
jgi:hypothetical protein